MQFVFNVASNRKQQFEIRKQRDNKLNIASANFNIKTKHYFKLKNELLKV